MRLTGRLLAYAAALVGVLLLVGSAAVRARAAAYARADTLGRLRAEAALAARAWAPGRDAAALADSLGTLLGRHVTLVDAGGRVRGDSEADDLAAPWLARYATLAGVRAAAGDRAGAAPADTSSAAGAPELAAAARGPAGVARVAAPLAGAGAALADDLRRALLAAGLAALGAAAVAALRFSRAVVRPLADLRDVARALAAGDLARRPSISAPGEVGEVADAVHRLAEQLGARFDALAAEEALLEALTESLAEGVVAVDARGQVVRLNATARRLLHLTDPVPFPADYLPRDRLLRDALAEALAGRVLAAGDDAAYGAAAADALELRVHGRTLALTARPLPAGGAVLAFFDLTPVRRLELVRRDFVANVSHELKTPLTAVSGYAETLADDGELPPVPRRFAATIAANAQRMQRIVDDLLDLSRIESGGWRPAPARVDVAAAADEALAPARDAARAKGLTLDVAPAPDAPAVWADPTAVRQVLSNLAENAVRHTATGRVRVTTWRADASTWLAVEDTGEGIGPEHLPRVFERFYRADPGRSRAQGGTGLGLSIVKHLAEAHGGAVRAESRPGAGTRIAVAFPEPPAAAGTPPAAATTTGMPPSVVPPPRAVPPGPVAAGPVATGAGAALAALAVCGALAGCAPSTPELTGAGGSFPAPVYARWAAEYARATGVRVNYQPIGSGGGLRQLADRTVDFGGTDVPRGPAGGAGDGRVAYVPMLLGAVAVTYHVPGLAAPLRLTPEAAADLFLGRITRWDDPRLADLNPGARLPALDVLVVHRAEGSGTTYILSDYLSAVSAAWRAAAGRGTAVRWAAGVGVRGNDGVAGLVRQTPGAVGYVEAAYAARAGLPAAAVRNRTGRFVAPSPGGAEAAAAAVAGRGASADLRASLVDAPGAASYPLASFTWLLLDRAPRDPARARAVATFARWALRRGGDARALGFAPLPAPVAARADSALAALGGAAPAGAAGFALGTAGGRPSPAARP